MAARREWCIVGEARLSLRGRGFINGAMSPERKRSMRTLKECVEGLKCRKGAADGTTKDGAYWLAAKSVETRSCGGDGIGQSAPDVRWWLQIRHYRGGEVRVVMHRKSWHQNHGDKSRFRSVPVADMTTVEQIVVKLKEGVDMGDGYDTETCYSDERYDALAETLKSIGLVEREPGPDE